MFCNDHQPLTIRTKQLPFLLPVLAVAVLLAPTVARAAEAPCPNERLRAEQPFASRLPDCRAYEMVSPLQKDDNGVAALDSRAAVSGEAIAYFSPGSFDEPKAALLEGRYLSRRGPDGWTTQNISPSYTDYRSGAGGEHPPFVESLFTPELSSGIVRSFYSPLVEGEPPGYINLYAADLEDGSYRAVSHFSPEDDYQPFEELPSAQAPQAQWVSGDLSRVVFQQDRAVGGSPPHEHVYEWAGGEPVLVDVAPPGVTFEGDDNVGAPASKNEPAHYGDAWNAVAGDGSRVFFTGQESARNEDVGQLFVRENPLAPQSPYSEGKCAVPGDACTVEVSASQRSVPDPNASKAPWAFFRDASVDGSRVFFTSRVELTNDANTGPEDNAANLYEYNLDTGVLTDLTVPTAAEEGEDPQGAAVLGLVTASEDGSYVYFVANGVLAARAKPGNCKQEKFEGAVVGERSCSLYVEHNDGTGWEAPRLIATLAGSNATTFSLGDQDGDEEDWVGYEPNLNSDFGPGRHTARVSPDGTRLTFESELGLTGYDNKPVNPGQCANERCREVYLYNAQTGKLVCVSCDPSEGQPTGPAELGGHEEVGGSFSDTYPYYLPNNLSDGGGRVFFQSPDALVPHDGNGVLDVYEWEQPATAAEAETGENSCTTGSPDFDASEEGCVVAMSDVAGNYESRFMDASTNGDNVFIATIDQLVPADTDSRADVYDVRVDGGFPVSAPAPVCTNADSCKPPVAPQPAIYGAPASATFSGPGSPVSLPLAPVSVVKAAKKKTVVKCKKPKRLDRGKCLSKKKRAKAKTPAKGRRRHHG